MPPLDVGSVDGSQGGTQTPPFGGDTTDAHMVGATPGGTVGGDHTGDAQGSHGDCMVLHVEGQGVL